MRKVTTVILTSCVLLGLHTAPVSAAPPSKAQPQTISWEEE